MSDFEGRLRAVEDYCNAHEPKIEERWGNQFSWNKTMDSKLNDLSDCVRDLKTSLRVNNVRLAVLFFAAQVVVSGAILAVIAKVFGQ